MKFHNNLDNKIVLILAEDPRMFKTSGLRELMMMPFDLKIAYVFLSYHAFTNTE